MKGFYDLIVIGGGVTGAGVVRDAAMRGLSCLLVERGSFGQGTTRASSRLVHGGLRYLLYDRLTTHETSWDSGHIVRIAGPMLRRLPILWPVYRDHRHGIEMVEALLEAYDPFQRMKLGRSHLRISAEAALRLVPGLKREGLVGAAAFDEWAVAPLELVAANIASARRHGAEAVEKTGVAGFLRDGARVAGVRTAGPEGMREVRARLVVNASGPAVNEVAGLAGAEVPLRLRQGTHLVYPGRRLPVGLLVEAVDRRRVVFVLPFKKETLVGPTDVRAPEGARPEPRTEELAYLLATMKRYFPDWPERCGRTICGARPILGQASDESLLSREHQVIDHGDEGAPGLVTIAGGKLSSYRLMAEETVDAVCLKLGRTVGSRTRFETLSGEPVAGSADFRLPAPAAKDFLSDRPRMRQLYALSHLGLTFGAHWFRRLAPSGVEAFWAHYEGHGPTFGRDASPA